MQATLLFKLAFRGITSQLAEQHSSTGKPPLTGRRFILPKEEQHIACCILNEKIDTGNRHHLQDLRVQPFRYPHQRRSGVTTSSCGRGNTSRRPARAGLRRKKSRKCQGRTSRKSGDDASTFVSSVMGIQVPGVSAPNLSGLMSPITSMSLASKPQY